MSFKPRGTATGGKNETGEEAKRRSQQQEGRPLDDGVLALLGQQPATGYPSCDLHYQNAPEAASRMYLKQYGGRQAHEGLVELVHCSRPRGGDKCAS